MNSCCSSVTHCVAPREMQKRHMHIKEGLVWVTSIMACTQDCDLERVSDELWDRLFVLSPNCVTSEVIHVLQSRKMRLNGWSVIVNGPPKAGVN